MWAIPIQAQVSNSFNKNRNKMREQFVVRVELPLRYHTHMSTTNQEKRSWTDRTAGRWFYTAIAAAAMLISLAAFVPSMADTSSRPGGASLLSVTHGILFFAWLVIFLAQTLLVQVRKVSIHRTLGTASMFLAAAMVITGYFAAVAMTRRGFDLSGDLNLPGDVLGPHGQIIFLLVDIIEFALLVAAGYIWRRNIAAHRRLMLFATLAILPGSFAHVIGHFSADHTHSRLIIPFVAVSCAVSAVYDLIRFRRIHPVSLWVGLAIFTIDGFCNNHLGPSVGWHHFVDWLVR